MPPNAPTVAMASADDDGNYVIQQSPLSKGGLGVVTDDRANEIVDSIFGTTSSS